MCKNKQTNKQKHKQTKAAPELMFSSWRKEIVYIFSIYLYFIKLCIFVNTERRFHAKKKIHPRDEWKN